ncbi:hypothetical protein [Phyllobacterium myrsinacearum]|uniref:Putative membrane-anchored protein n=1 Tax=Phyllobacterium myrsinacearum TaxID=28101 RepID=A0A839EPL5_9HYPH|nr:hypothetical protein [Phyllobacterium myrsinacearum]MBA8880772.1 putative membrane-anchored protein [Phyllobacterium myrsinacearum]
MKINRFLLSGALIALLQTGTLYAMVEKHAMVLRHGTSIMLETEPVDLGISFAANMCGSAMAFHP